jgi:trigger factor
LIRLDLKKDPEGILKALVGAFPGSQRVIKVKERVTVTVNVKQLKVKEIAPLDDSFAKTVGSFESMEALKQAIRADLERQAFESQRSVLELQAMEQLLAGWACDVPPSLVASQAERLLKERAIDLMTQGISAGQVQERAPILTERAKLDALKQVRLFFILRRIAQAEGITATAEEVEGRIQGLARRLRTPVEEVRRDLEARDLADHLTWGVIRSKVMDLIVKGAVIQEEDGAPQPEPAVPLSDV